MSEVEFWRSTPRKIGKLFEIHARFNGIKLGGVQKDSGVVYKKMNITDIPFLN